MPILPDPRQELFATLVALEDASYTSAARRTGASEASAANAGSRLAKLPAIIDRVTELRDQRASQALMASEANINGNNGRVKAIEQRWIKLRSLIDTRSVHPDYQQEPGANTGLLLRTEKITRSKESTSTEICFRLDTDLLRELREHEELAAVELGQRVKHSEQRTSATKLSVSGAELHSLLQSEFGALTPLERRTLVATLPALGEIIETNAVVDPSSEPDTDADARQSGDDSADAGNGDSGS